MNTNTNPKEKPMPNLTDPLWTNAHLQAYFQCCATTVIKLKKRPGFPPAARIGGMKRYPADQVRAYVIAQQATPADQSTPATTTTTGAQS